MWEPRCKWQGRVSPGERSVPGRKKERCMGLVGFRKWRKAHVMAAGWVRGLVAGDSTGSEREAGASGVSVPGRFREDGVERWRLSVWAFVAETHSCSPKSPDSFFFPRVSANYLLCSWVWPCDWVIKPEWEQKWCPYCLSWPAKHAHKFSSCSFFCIWLTEMETITRVV